MEVSFSYTHIRIFFELIILSHIKLIYKLVSNSLLYQEPTCSFSVLAGTPCRTLKQQYCKFASTCSHRRPMRFPLNSSESVFANVNFSQMDEARCTHKNLYWHPSSRRVEERFLVYGLHRKAQRSSTVLNEQQ